MALPRPTPLLVFTVALAGLCAVNVLPRAGRFSGDAMIHLGIAERAASGRWFRVQPRRGHLGHHVARLDGPGGGPAGPRGLPPHARGRLLPHARGPRWRGPLLVRRLALRLGATGPAALAGGAALASLPGVASNAPLGMESGAFACASLAFLLAVTTPGRLGRPLHAAALGALLGLCVLLRPEGVLCSVAAAVALASSGSRRRAGAAALALAAVLVVAPALYAHWRITGRLLPGSGLSRVMAARRDPASIHLAGPLWLYLAAPARLLVQLPLAWLAFEGARPAGPLPSTRRALLATLAAGFALYTLITGAAHVARLTVWLWALLSALAAGGALPAARPWRRDWLAVACAAHLTVAGAETVARCGAACRRGAAASTRATLLPRATDGRRARTNRVLRSLCSGGCCREGVVPSVAAVEVQRRITLDARVSVASLDGVTAPARGGGPSVGFDPATGCPRMDALLSHSAVLGVLEDPGAQLSRCTTSPLARALSLAWERPSLAPPGWRWDLALHGWVRRCHPAPITRRRARHRASRARRAPSRAAPPPRPTSP